MAREKTKYGPYSFEQMRQWASSGQLLHTDMVYQEGTVKWKRASEVEELLIPLFQNEWYIVRGGVRSGPYSTERMKEFIADNPPCLLPNDIVQGKLVPASEVDDLFPRPDGRSKNGVIYLITVPSWPGCYKIGLTTRSVPDERLYEIGLKLPEQPELIHYIKTNQVDHAEKHWHRRFAEKRTRDRCEWFRLTPEDIDEFRRCSEMTFSANDRREFFCHDTP